MENWKLYRYRVHGNGLMCSRFEDQRPHPPRRRRRSAAQQPRRYELLDGHDEAAPAAEQPAATAAQAIEANSTGGAYNAQ